MSDTGGYPKTFSTAQERQEAALHSLRGKDPRLSGKPGKPQYPRTRILKTAEKIEEDKKAIKDYMEKIRQWTGGKGLSSLFMSASDDYRDTGMNPKKNSSTACISKFNELLRARDTENIIPESLLNDGHTAAGYRFKKKRRTKTRPRSRKKSRKKSRRRKTRSKRLSR